MTAPEPENPTTRPSVAALFTGFLTLGLMGFGGVLPLTRRMVVEERRWLSEAEFAELLGLCQFLPGGNVINLSVAIGLEFAGIAGAFAALLGLLAAPTAIVIALGAVYTRFQGDPALQHLFAGLAAAAAGLVIATAMKMAKPLLKKPIALIVAAVCFAAIAFLRLPLLPTMLVLAAVSTALHWRLRS
jgi:chromate transporter